MTEDKTTATWKVEVWCEDCYGQDDYGCFDGGSEILEESFSSMEAAKIAGDEYTSDCGPWSYKVFTVDGE